MSLAGLWECTALSALDLQFSRDREGVVRELDFGGIVLF